MAHSSLDLAALAERLRGLDDAALRATAGPSVFARGRDYAAARRVRGLEIAGPWAVGAGVQGNGRSYRTQVTLYLARGELQWSGTCTCPMQVDCKHAVAVAIVARQTLGSVSSAGGLDPGGSADDAAEGRGTGTDGLPRPPNLARLGSPTWEQALRGVLGDPAARTDWTPVGLLVEVAGSMRGPYGAHGTDPGAHLVVRPVAPGKQGWVLSALTWTGLDYLGGHSAIRLAPAQLAALRALVAPVRQGWSYRPGDRVRLDQLGSGWAAALRECRRSGIRLLTHQRHSGEVILPDEPARVVLDLATDEGGGVTVAPQITLPEAVRELEGTWTTIGAVPSGLWLASGADLAIVGIDPPLDVETMRLLDGGPVRVPPADVGRFRSRALPVLARRFEISSGDGSMTVPEVGPPQLLVTVTHEPGLRLSVRFAMTYAVGSDRLSAPLPGATGTPAPGLDAIRDRAAEAALFERLDCLDRLGCQPPLRRLSSIGERTLVPEIVLDGPSKLRWLNLVQPRLQEREDVVVEVLGEPVVYAEAEEPPVVALSITDTPGSTDWFDLDVRVRVGAEQVPMRSLITALTLDQEVVILDSGTWFRVDQPELAQLRRLVEEARAMAEDPRGPLRLSAYQTDLWSELEALGVVEEQSGRWTALVAGMRSDAAPEPLPPPADLAATLRPYQQAGYEWLSFLRRAGLGGVLADDMGLGKTLQVLAMVLAAKADKTALGGDGTAYPPVLVVAPTSVLATWVSEAARFAPSLRVVTLGETTARRGVAVAAAAAGADLVVTSYAVFRLDAEGFREAPWSVLVLDEAQFVKNHQSQAYHCARTLPAPSKFAITGTPMENNLMELWALLSIVAPGLFPRPKAFQEHFRRPIESGELPERLDTLRRRIRSVMLRRTKEAVASELPPKQEQVIPVTLSAKHRRIYDRGLAHERQRVLGLLDDARRNRIAIFRSLTRLRQLSLDPALVDSEHAGVGSAKIDALVDLLAPVVAEGHQALVFSQFTGFLARVRARLDAEGISYAYLDGRTTRRDEVIADFRSGARSVFLVSLKAGGFGLTLTEADYVFLLDPWWNPAVEAQAVDRAHRIGQDKHVFVYRLVSADTIEDKVLTLQARKRELFAQVVDEGALAGGALTAEDIRALL